METQRILPVLAPSVGVAKAEMRVVNVEDSRPSSATVVLMLNCTRQRVAEPAMLPSLPQRK